MQKSSGKVNKNEWSKNLISN